MAETANIARMAEILADKLFAEFLWVKTGPTNKNWTCEAPEDHGVKTHPSDVVFYYEEPYSQNRTYINCDLKSFAKDSIQSNNVKAAIQSLAQQVACAEVSDEWRSLYARSQGNINVCGLLFIYNHDGEYDKNFQTLLEEVEMGDLDIPRGSKVVVLGPQDIFWINNVRYEIVQMRGDNEIPSRENCSYFYPQLQTIRKVQLDRAKAATLEVLTSPLILLKYINPLKEYQKGFVLFYRGKGGGVEEFMYLIDFLRLSDVLEDSVEISIKTLQPDKNSAAYFQRAVRQYNQEMEENGEEGESPLAEIISKIRYSQIGRVVPEFSDVEIGMNYE